MQPGTRLGPYEVVARIGAGGMGVVWRARDTRLGRDVAIKVLPPELAADAALKARFDREAKTISHFSHPNICAIFDVGDDYLVMELLDGESLADRLARSPLPLADVIRYGVQIAEALGRAHAEGIIHRDLKPANIMLTKSGAKLLDFGLAKQITPRFVAQASLQATEQKPLTEEGTIVGTLQYMAPEQLAGEEPDARTDIFALGAVLYEMATGRRAFDAKTRTSLIGAIVSGEPKPMSELQPLTPPALEHVVRKCLAKERDQRWQSASDIGEELRWIGESGTRPADAHAARRRFTGERVAWAAALIVVAAVAAWFPWNMRRTSSTPVMRVAIPLPPATMIDFKGLVAIAISPDGNTVLYSAAAGGTSRLWIRRIGRFEARTLPGTEGAISPFFSPDGQWIAFATPEGMLKKIAVTGSAALPLCATGASVVRGGDWSEDGTIYFAPGSGSGIWKVSADGGKPVPVSRPDRARNEISHRWPQLLPDRRHAVVTIKTAGMTSFDAGRIGILSLADGTVRTVIEGGTFARYVPTGNIVFASGSTLYAVRFDPGTQRPGGVPIALVDGMFVDRSSGVAHCAFSQTGSLLYLPDPPPLANKIKWISRVGRIDEVSTGEHLLANPRVSPDGSKLAAICTEGASDDICVFDRSRGTVARLSLEGGNEASPVWTADGSAVIYSAELETTEGTRILRKGLDGSGPAEELVRSSSILRPSSVSPDGTVAAIEMNKDTRADIWFYAPSTRTRTKFLATPFNETRPQFSPDGRLLAWQSDESGRNEIYVQSLTGARRRVQVSAEGGVAPQWSRDGGSVFYWNGNYCYQVRISAGSGLTATAPQRLTGIGEHLPDLNGIQEYDVDPAGGLVIAEARHPLPVTHLNFVVNWFEDVRQRTAAR